MFYEHRLTALLGSGLITAPFKAARNLITKKSTGDAPQASQDSTPAPEEAPKALSVPEKEAGPINNIVNAVRREFLYDPDGKPKPLWRKVLNFGFYPLFLWNMAMVAKDGVVAPITGATKNYVTRAIPGALNHIWDKSLAPTGKAIVDTPIAATNGLLNAGVGAVNVGLGTASRIASLIPGVMYGATSLATLGQWKPEFLKKGFEGAWEGGTNRFNAAKAQFGVSAFQTGQVIGNVKNVATGIPEGFGRAALTTVPFLGEPLERGVGEKITGIADSIRNSHIFADIFRIGEKPVKNPS